MKKRLFSIALIFGVLLLCSCSGTSNTSDTIKIEGEEQQQAEYVVNIDDSFNTGLEFDDTKKTLSPEEADFRNLKWGMTMRFLMHRAVATVNLKKM